MVACYQPGIRFYGLGVPVKQRARPVLQRSMNEQGRDLFGVGFGALKKQSDEGFLDTLRQGRLAEDT